ncbi:ATP/GTP-binding protein [Helicobacter pylori]|nr:ATP/GTP-binding protein [Helicobacter pylori]
MIQAMRKILDENQLEKELNERLNQFDKSIQAIRFSANNQLKLKVKGIKEKVPLSVFGDGLKKYLHIVSAFMADNAKTIYIDEVENGLHFSRMRLLLRCVIDFINDNKDGNLQVFMTTHNQEFIEILDQVIREKDFAHQTKLFCLEQYDDLIVAESYYGENLSLYFKNSTNLFGGKERFKENNYE